MVLLSVAYQSIKKRMKMKKIILTLSVFTLTLFSMAQTAPRHFHVIDPDGWVNMRAGAGTDYEVIRTVNKWRIVSRDFNRRIINNWIPVKYAEAEFSFFEKGYIHGSRLRPIDFGFLQIVPETSAVDVEKRARLQRIVDEIDAMELQQDTLRYIRGRNFFDFDPPRPQMLEVLSEDRRSGRLKKYHWGSFPGGESEMGAIEISAYYDVNGNLVAILYSFRDRFECFVHVYWLYEGRIVDFLIEQSCPPRTPPYDRIWSDERVNELRSEVGSPLTKTFTPRGWLSLTDFLDTQTLLSIVNSENYRGRIHRIIELYKMRNSEID
jgi:hypothetical protein